MNTLSGVPGLSYIVADAVTHRTELIVLNVEYFNWVVGQMAAHFGVRADEVLGMPAHAYVPTVIDKVCGDAPPRGVFYLAKIDGETAGMGGLRFLRDGVAEIKRIYFRPAYRGRGLGESMLTRLLSDATAFGYRQACLDSAPFMTSAHKVYESCGFADCSAYEGTEVPPAFHARWRFMERAL